MKQRIEWRPVGPGNWQPERDDGIDAGDVTPEVGQGVKTGRAHEPQGDNQVQYQRCGGGRRVIRKPIGV